LQTLKRPQEEKAPVLLALFLGQKGLCGILTLNGTLPSKQDHGKRKAPVAPCQKQRSIISRGGVEFPQKKNKLVHCQAVAMGGGGHAKSTRPVDQFSTPTKKK